MWSNAWLKARFTRSSVKREDCSPGNQAGKCLNRLFSFNSHIAYMDPHSLGKAVVLFVRLVTTLFLCPDFGAALRETVFLFIAHLWLIGHSVLLGRAWSTEDEAASLSAAGNEVECPR